MFQHKSHLKRLTICLIAYNGQIRVRLNARTMDTRNAYVRIIAYCASHKQSTTRVEENVTRMMHSCTVATFTVNVRGAFSGLVRTPVVGIVGYFNKNVCKYILETHLLPFKKNVHCDNLFFALK